MNQGVIYSISCPIHKKIIYVGQTINFEARCRSYFQVNISGTAIEIYVKQLVKKELRPIFTIHKRCNVDDLNKEEYSLLDKFIADGLLLLNRRNNKPNNYHSAREYYLGIKRPVSRVFADIIDLTDIQHA